MLTFATLASSAAFAVLAQRSRFFSVLLFLACVALPFAVAADLGVFQ